MDPPSGGDNELLKRLAEEAAQTRARLAGVLLESLQMQHLVVLAGSGASRYAGGPSMDDLWLHAVGDEPSKDAQSVASVMKYDLDQKDRKNIETFMSSMDAYLQVHPDADPVKKLLEHCRSVVLNKCRAFTNAANLSAHGSFLHKLARRRTRDTRLKVFTTNYDTCFEVAAGSLGCVAIDGFGFTTPRHYDPRFYGYDLVRRPDANSNTTSYLEGVFVLHKLHGSVDWARRGDHIVQDPGASADEACIVYPANAKYQKSFEQPHLESLSQFLSVLRQPNTCLLVLGFGFNDKHLSEPVLSAARSNPHFRLVIADPNAASRAVAGGPPYWADFDLLAKEGGDIHFLEDTFDSFVKRVPDLKAMTPAMRLYEAVKDVAKQTAKEGP